MGSDWTGAKNMRNVYWGQLKERPEGERRRREMEGGEE